MATFEDFYDETVDAVTSYVLRRCDPSDAQDVISETYVIAWRKHAHAAPNPIGYLLLTARRVLDRTRRSQASRDVVAERLSRLMSRSPSVLRPPASSSRPARPAMSSTPSGPLGGAGSSRSLRQARHLRSCRDWSCGWCSRGVPLLSSPPRHRRSSPVPL